MLEERVRKNLYKLIEQYYKILKKQYKKQEIDYKKVEQIPNPLKQNILNYETSIYKNIETKQIPFTQLFNLDKKIIYTLSPKETDILRNYVGIYDNGVKQSVEEVSRRFNITTSKTTSTLKRIMDLLETQSAQKELIKERNERIKNKIEDEKYKEEILSTDITFLNITENFIDILKKENINTVRDILKITDKQIKNMNRQYGYYYSLEIIPKRLVEEIHELGLKFENELMIGLMFQKIEGVEINTSESIGKTFETLTDAICARQFEPELLSRLNLQEYFKIDTTINRGYMQGKYIDMSEDLLLYHTQTKNNKTKELDYRHGKIYQSDNN